MTRLIRNFNLENRAEREISKIKPSRAPRHPSTKNRLREQMSRKWCEARGGAGAGSCAGWAAPAGDLGPATRGAAGGSASRARGGVARGPVTLRRPPCARGGVPEGRGLCPRRAGPRGLLAFNSERLDSGNQNPKGSRAAEVFPARLHRRTASLTAL